MKTNQELNELFDELQAIMIRCWPPEEFGEDEDLSSIFCIAKELRDEAIRRNPNPQT
jgi:hypothetical protein